MGLGEEDFWFIFYCIFAGGIGGSKLLYWIVEYRQLLEGSLRPFADLRYGFVYYGGFLGGLAAAWWAARRRGAEVLRILDYFAAALPLGHAIGRLGCLAAGCCYGRPTSLPWGLVPGGHPDSITPRALWGLRLHPTPLYESLANLAVFLLLARALLPAAESGRAPRGSVLAWYAVLYGSTRFAVEALRADDRGAWAGLSTSQWLALATALAGLAAAAALRRRHGR